MNPSKDRFLATLATREPPRSPTSLSATPFPRSRSPVSAAQFLYSSGYAGYIPGVKSENVFGQTYGKTSYASQAQSFHRGIDEPAHLKYNTLMKAEFINHAEQSHETIAQMVGVDRGDSYFNRVSYDSIVSIGNALFVTAYPPILRQRLLEL